MSNTLKLLAHKGRQKGVLLPLLEDFMLHPVNIETDDDVKFLTDLFKTMAEREARRRDDTNVFSPSALASCLRKVYLLKNSHELGIEKLTPVRREPNFYFLNGNFLHVKWQFALYKMEKKINDPAIFRVHGFEIPIMSKRGDHGGTSDVIAFVHGVPYVIDVKGLNVRSFGEITRGYMSDDYKLQLTDYMILWNSQRKKPFEIKQSLLLAESKGGPDNKHPIALHETVIDLTENKPEVKRRLELLRQHESEEIIPAPECTSTGTFQFTGCPFAKFCRKEITEVQRQTRKREARETSQVTVSRPTRRRARKGRVAKT